MDLEGLVTTKQIEANNVEDKYTNYYKANVIWDSWTKTHTTGFSTQTWQIKPCLHFWKARYPDKAMKKLDNEIQFLFIE